MDIRHPGPPARRWPRRARAPALGRNGARRPSACTGDRCRGLATADAVIHIAADPADMTTTAADTGELPGPGETTLPSPRAAGLRLRFCLPRPLSVSYHNSQAWGDGSDRRHPGVHPRRVLAPLHARV